HSGSAPSLRDPDVHHGVRLSPAILLCRFALSADRAHYAPMRDDMTKQPTAPEPGPARLDGPAIAYRALWALCGAVGVIDLFYEKHAVYKIEEFPAFYGLFAF